MHDYNGLLCTVWVRRDQYAAAYSRATKLRRIDAGIDLDTLHDHTYPDPANKASPHRLSDRGIWSDHELTTPPVRRELASSASQPQVVEYAPQGYMVKNTSLEPIPEEGPRLRHVASAPELRTIHEDSILLSEGDEPLVDRPSGLDINRSAPVLDCSLFPPQWPPRTVVGHF